MPNVYVRPAVVDGAAVLVRNPEKAFAPLPPEGDWVRDTDPYWGARLRDRDVVEGDPPAQAEPEAPNAEGEGKKPSRKG